MPSLEYILSVDPGLDGAFAYFRGRSLAEVISMPTVIVKKRGKKKKVLDFKEIAFIFQSYLPAIKDGFIAIENIAASPQMGSASAFSFGSSFGSLLTGAYSVCPQVYTIPPILWKKKNGLVNKNKAAGAKRALAIYPNAGNFLYGPRGGVKDGVADAILIGDYFMWERKYRNV